MNAGHYIHLKRLDFDDINIQKQCIRCNLRLHGNSGRFAYQIVKRFGIGALDRLEPLREVEWTIKRKELEEIIIKLNNELSKMNNNQ